MLEDVSIGITSFCRWGYLAVCLQGIANNLPECKVIVADDSFDDRCAKIAGQDCIRLPADSGLTCKRNATVQACKTKYWLCGSDDFDFSTIEARIGIKKLVQIMEENLDIDVAGGRVNANPYEGMLEYEKGQFIREHRVIENGELFIPVDLTVNYFLARTSRIVLWDEKIFPIGGEHVDWFLSMKEASRKLVWVLGVNITTLNLGDDSSIQDPRYGSFRRRAFQAGHRIMKEKRQIKDYIDWDGNKS